jgi:hypothetical protein
MIIERIERTLVVFAYFIELDGDVQVPMYEKFEAELAELRGGRHVSSCCPRPTPAGQHADRVRRPPSPAPPRTAGACRRLAKLMSELGWHPIKARGLTPGGFRDQVRGYARDTRGEALM